MRYFSLVILFFVLQPNAFFAQPQALIFFLPSPALLMMLSLYAMKRLTEPHKD